MWVFVAPLLFAVTAWTGALADTRGANPLSASAGGGVAFSSSHALVIGIDDYINGWRPLAKAIEDAEAVKEALERSGFDHVRIVRNPDRAELEEAFQDFVYTAGSDPNGRALIWFAGHGHTIRGEGYLVPRDAPLPGTTAAEDAAFRRGALSMRRFGEYLREINSRHVLAVFDSCFAGTIFNATRSLDTPPVVAAAAARSVRQIITSGSEGEVVADDGLFRRLFVEALEAGSDARGADGFLLGSRLGAHLEQSVVNYTNRRQHPLHGKLAHPDFDGGDFVFPGGGVEAGPAEVAVVPPAGAADQPGSARGLEAELRIETPDVARDEPIATFIADKLSRNLVEHFVQSGIKVSSDLTSRSPLREPTHRMRLSVDIIGEDALVDILLTDAGGNMIASGTLEGPADFLKRNYKVLPAAALYAADLSSSTLEPLRSAKRPTEDAFAYAVFLAARAMVQARRMEETREMLLLAVEIDERFAAAFEALAELAELDGEVESAEAYRQAALAIDPDFVRLPLLAPSQLGNPVPALLQAGGNASWNGLAAGLELRTLDAADYRIGVRGWRFDPSRFRIDAAVASSALGASAEDFRVTNEASLAINAGFFDLDMRSRVSPVGLLVAGGREISPFDAGKAANPLTGILYRTGNSIGILPARDHQPGERYDMALQSGPLVVDPGGRNGIRGNAFDRLERSALCLDFDSRPIIVKVDGGLSLYELGEVLSTPENDGGFGCERAINLDGGPSSQVSVSIEGGIFDAPGLWKVHSALLLSPQ